jgi:catechol 2,3-dioxygenase-like lactoylglutathione lyase family enzyme
MKEPLFRKVDCLRIPVPELNAGLAFYRDKLGHELIWRTETMAGLRMPDSDAEIVIHTQQEGMEVDLLVASAADGAAVVEQAGGRVVVAPFDTQIGKCTVVEDPWGNELVLLDMSKGSLITDEAGHVVGTRGGPDA